MAESATRLGDVVTDEQIQDELSDARDCAAAADGQPREVERVVLGAADDALAAVDALPEDEVREVLGHFYEFLDARVATQHRLLGRPAVDG